jgi:hypothetical protein
MATKQIGYREFIEYIVLNDDITMLDEGEHEVEFPTILMSACGHLFHKDMVEVTKSLRNKRDQFKKTGDIS